MRLEHRYKGVDYNATVPYNQPRGQKTIKTTIVVNEKQPVVIRENKSRNRRRRGSKRESMWHGLSADTDTENHPYWLGRKIRRFFFNQDCSNATTKQGFFRSEIGVVTGVRMIPIASSSSELDKLLATQVVDTSDWKVADVSTWLREKSLKGHERVDDVVRIFKEHSVDGDLIGSWCSSENITFLIHLLRGLTRVTNTTPLSLYRIPHSQ